MPVANTKVVQGQGGEDQNKQPHTVSWPMVWSKILQKYSTCTIYSAVVTPGCIFNFKATSTSLAYRPSLSLSFRYFAIEFHVPFRIDCCEHVFAARRFGTNGEGSISVDNAVTMCFREFWALHWSGKPHLMAMACEDDKQNQSS